MQQNLKVLMLNGSPRANGNTSVALKETESRQRSYWSAIKIFEAVSPVVPAMRKANVYSTIW